MNDFTCLKTDAADIFFLKINCEIDNDLYFNLLKFTSKEKQEKLKRFVRIEDACRGLFSDLLIRYLIIKRLKLKNEEISFNTSYHGKPSLINFPQFHFNLSHSGEWVACAVGDQPVGIDVEEIKEYELDIAKSWFASEEYHFLMNQKPASRTAAFFELWALKESYIKQVGKGLSINLNSFCINSSDPTNITVKLEGKLLDDIFFKLFHIDESYKAAACAHTNRFSDPRFIQFMDIINFFLI